MRIIVSLPEDRSHVGSLQLQDDSGQIIAGPFDALGKADSKAANEHDNASLDPTKPWGNTPTGTYEVSGFKETGNQNYPSHSYGPNGAIALQPVAGEALEARDNGRTGILIHGGDLGPNDNLRATNGCVRLDNEDMSVLMQALAEHQANNLRCEIVTVEVDDGSQAPDVDEGYDAGDPPPGFLDGLVTDPRMCVSAESEAVPATPEEVTAAPAEVTSAPVEVTPTPTEVAPAPAPAPAPAQVTPISDDVTPTPTEVTSTPTEVISGPTDEWSDAGDEDQ